jgi:two-component system, OmpR family, response regulator
VGKASLQPSHPLRVLVVDDYDDARDCLCMLLRIWGCQAEPAADGPSALAAAPAFRPDVVLLDLAMPGMDGYETARRLRELPRPPLLVALTGYGRDEDRESTRRAGFVAHLLKPVEPADLRALLGRAAGLLRLVRAAAVARAITRHRRIQASGAGGRKLSPEAVSCPP